MPEDAHGDVVGDAVDAVTLNQDVQWERCARLAKPAERRALDTLRELSRIFAGSHTAGIAPSTALEPPVDFRAGAFVRRAVHVLMAVAAVQVAATMLLLPWRWEDYHRAHGDLAVYAAILLVGYGASSALLLLAGRRDRRTWLLGGFFLFRATLAPLHMLPFFFGQVPPFAMSEASAWDAPLPTVVFVHLSYPLVFAISPAFLWAFARECPQVHRRTRLDDLARGMVPVSVAIGCAMSAGLASIHVARLIDDTVSGAFYVAVLDGTAAAASVLSLAAVVVVALRAHTAPTAEVRRVVVFSLGFLIWVGLGTAYDLVEALSPGSWVSNYEPGSVLVLVQLIRFPGMVLLWYSVLAVRVPHPREMIRAGYRRLLVRPSLLGGAAVAPVVGVGWLLWSNSEQEVGAVIASPLAQSLTVAAGILLVLAINRDRLLRRLDAWVYPESSDQRQFLAVATAALAKAERVATISRTLTRAVKRGCGSPGRLLMADATQSDSCDFKPADTAIAPLSRTSAIVHILTEAGGSLRVHPSDTKSVFGLLPARDAAWVAETEADVIVAVPGTGAEVVGVLVVGRRFDDRIVRAADVTFLEVLASAAGQAVMRLRLLHGSRPRLSEPPPALECPACGCVAGSEEPPGCACGPAYVETGVPRLLAGRFRLTRWLGAGGMGTVYLVHDVRLDRHVAVKTLSGTSVSRMMGLQPEAWAMARVAHAALAQIYGVESWRGRPFLIVEFLSGGTLAARLEEGPIPAPQSVAVTIHLAEALAALHRAGYLHGDVKPSNIGFTADGLSKLLDFGLARPASNAAVAGGTLRYLSPEVLSGRPAEAADDVWSLCVVLYEMVSGEHPFAGGEVEDVADRIRRQRLGRRARSASDTRMQSTVVAFAATVLATARSARPATARAFADALGGVLGKE